MNTHEQFQLIDKFLRQSLSKNESDQLQLLRQDPGFEDTFLLMLELRTAFRYIKMSEKLAYIKHLELSLTVKADETPTISTSLKQLINEINSRLQMIIVFAGLKLQSSF